MNFSGKRLTQLHALVPIDPVAPKRSIFIKKIFLAYIAGRLVRPFEKARALFDELIDNPDKQAECGSGKKNAPETIEYAAMARYQFGGVFNLKISFYQ